MSQGSRTDGPSNALAMTVPASARKFPPGAKPSGVTASAVEPETHNWPTGNAYGDGSRQISPCPIWRGRHHLVHVAPAQIDAKLRYDKWAIVCQSLPPFRRTRAK